MRSLRSLRRLPGARARSTSASSPAPSAAIADVLQAGPSVDVDEPKCRHELERASLDAAINQLLPYESGRRYIVPDVQLTSHAELGADAERHERVISLLPPQVRTQLLSAGSLGRQLWASASAEGSVPDLKALPKEAGPGVVLVTDGPEQVLADSLADALAWELGASSLVCRDAGRAAPGPFNLDMTPDIRDPLNREFAERQRADAADVLRSVFLPADGSSSSSGSPKTALGGGAVARPPLPPSPVVLLLTQELVVLQHQRVPRSNARPGQESAPAWLQLAHELVSKTILTVRVTAWLRTHGGGAAHRASPPALTSSSPRVCPRCCCSTRSSSTRSRYRSAAPTRRRGRGRSRCRRRRSPGSRWPTRCRCGRRRGSGTRRARGSSGGGWWRRPRSGRPLMWSASSSSPT